MKQHGAQLKAPRNSVWHVQSLCTVPNLAQNSMMRTSCKSTVPINTSLEIKARMRATEHPLGRLGNACKQPKPKGCAYEGGNARHASHREPAMRDVQATQKGCFINRAVAQYTPAAICFGAAYLQDHSCSAAQPCCYCTGAAFPLSHLEYLVRARVWSGGGDGAVRAASLHQDRIEGNTP